MKLDIILNLITITILLLPTMYGMEPGNNSRFRRINANHVQDRETGKIWWRPELSEPRL